MFCAKCGSEVKNSVNFCVSCGASVTPNQNNKLSPVVSGRGQTKKAFGFDFKVGSVALKWLVTLLIFINTFSGIIGGIWLAILGQWGIIFAGFGYSFIMPFLYALVSLPNMGLLLLLGKAVEKRNKFFTGLLGLVSGLYTYGVLAFWVILVFSNFVLNAELRDFLPLLLWGYSTVMAPLSYMASKEDDTNSSGIALIYAQVMYLVLTIILFFGISGGAALFLLAIPIILMAVFLVATIVKGYAEQDMQLASATEASSSQNSASVSNERKYVHLGLASDEELWGMVLESASRDRDTHEMMAFIKKHFFDEDDIKPVRYFANVTVLNSGSRSKASDKAFSKDELNLSPHATQSIDWLVETNRDSLPYDDWFMAAYPDVVKWAAEMVKISEEKFTKLLGDSKEEELFDVDGKMDMKYLRKMIDEYKKGNKLEASISHKKD